MYKYSVFPCSSEKVQLGIHINTRKMMLTLPDDKFQRLNNTLTSTWHASRKSFTILEGLTFLGYLEHSCTVYSWGKFFFCALRSAVNNYLRTRVHHMSKLSDAATMVSTIRDAKSTEEQALFDVFLQKKISKSLYQSKEPCFISNELSIELTFLRHLMSHPKLYP